VKGGRKAGTEGKEGDGNQMAKGKNVQAPMAGPSEKIKEKKSTKKKS